MDAFGSIKSATSGKSVETAAAPTITVPKDEHVEAATEDTSQLDAVAVSLTAKQIKDTEEAKSEEQSAAAEYLHDVETKDGRTAVRFDLDTQKDGKHLLSFKVVDETTGEVIRQFPPDQLPELLVKAHAGIDQKKNVLLDSLI